MGVLFIQIGVFFSVRHYAANLAREYRTFDASDDADKALEATTSVVRLLAEEAEVEPGSWVEMTREEFYRFTGLP